MKMKRFEAVLMGGILLSACVPAPAQWLNLHTQGVPRKADGKPDLSAPAPKTADGKPDFSGLWQTTDRHYIDNLAFDTGQPPALPWADEFYKKVRAQNGAGRPQERCLPHGLTDYDSLPMPFKIIQTPGSIAILYETYNHYRQIFLDGRALPKDPQPTWMGYSTGKWEGDTLVVESNGFNDRTWLDDDGHPHTEALRVTERFRRPDFGHIGLQLIVDDPKAYTKPWGATLHLTLVVDDELIESICENEKDLGHIVGK
jgi:hypothetical protein